MRAGEEETIGYSDSFIAAAQEAALSRLYGGIHYELDNQRGYECGELIATHVENLNC